MNVLAGAASSSLRPATSGSSSRAGLPAHRGADPDGTTATGLAFLLAAFPAGIAVALISPDQLVLATLASGRPWEVRVADVDPAVVLVGGLIAFGVVFAANSAVHSYLILAYAEGDKVAMSVGFHFMANAFGRLGGDRPVQRAISVAGP